MAEGEDETMVVEASDRRARIAAMVNEVLYRDSL